ncbi:MAG: bifunctional UDP-N-acetylglucosamine diphosphorylase/glucosamine-1-phosphate N-acetyltransferase GlmU [Desulfovibrio sp.]|nr:bifunctional UDP-N-acetylglucosamine diphosphorylase/glucosamine-1-phosphate N-acetyltransferase GlmU [Desulfovibrio sp.]
MEKRAALILAAGKGTRMHSPKPKVLQKILGSPMLACVYQALKPLFGSDIITLVGHRADLVQASFPEEHFVVQNEQLGTGHALTCALPELCQKGYSHVLVVNGDVPLVTEDLLRRFLDEACGSDLAFATIQLDDAAAYGRVVRRNGQIAIVEAKDYDESRDGPVTGEINAGLYWLTIDLAKSLLPMLTPSPKSGEYYITDLVALACQAKARVQAVMLGRDNRLLGVNSPKELSEMEELLRQEIVQGLLAKGVICHAPELLRVGPLAQVEAGSELTGPCEIYGHSRICAGAEIASHCYLEESCVAEGARIHSFSHLSGAEVGVGALVGPYARLRPGAVLEEDSHVGNFVELKKARLGRGAKANHLSYLGDASIGQGTNIGAGTITCNYDGKNKHRTEIGEKAFIGSNTALVAPVRVGAGALVGAGSTITHDVPEDNLSVARAKQKNFAQRFRQHDEA